MVTMLTLPSVESRLGGRGADSGVLVDACVVAAAGLAGLKLRHHQEVERPPSSGAGVTEPGVHPL